MPNQRLPLTGDARDALYSRLSAVSRGRPATEPFFVRSQEHMSDFYTKGQAGEQAVADYLRSQGRSVTASGDKTFDLIVDGRYAEVKSVSKCFDTYDFITLTDKQYQALESGVDFSIFLVCNLGNDAAMEIREFPAALLLKERPAVYRSYEWSRTKIRRLLNAAGAT